MLRHFYITPERAVPGCQHRHCLDIPALLTWLTTNQRSCTNKQIDNLFSLNTTCMVVNLDWTIDYGKCKNVPASCEGPTREAPTDLSSIVQFVALCIKEFLTKKEGASSAGMFHRSVPMYESTSTCAARKRARYDRDRRFTTRGESQQDCRGTHESKGLNGHCRQGQRHAMTPKRPSCASTVDH